MLGKDSDPTSHADFVDELRDVRVRALTRRGRWRLYSFIKYLDMGSATKAPNERVAPVVSAGHSNPSPDGQRAPTQEPSKDREERLYERTYICPTGCTRVYHSETIPIAGGEESFEKGKRDQDSLRLFFMRFSFLSLVSLQFTSLRRMSYFYCDCMFMVFRACLVCFLRISKRAVLRHTALVDASLHCCCISVLSKHQLEPVARVDYRS